MDTKCIDKTTIWLIEIGRIHESKSKSNKILKSHFINMHLWPFPIQMTQHFKNQQLAHFKSPFKNTKQKWHSESQSYTQQKANLNIIPNQPSHAYRSFWSQSFRVPVFENSLLLTHPWTPVYVRQNIRVPRECFGELL